MESRIRHIVGQCTACMRAYCTQNPYVSAFNWNYLSQRVTNDHVASIPHLAWTLSYLGFPIQTICEGNSRAWMIGADLRTDLRALSREFALRIRELDAPGIAFSQRSINYPHPAVLCTYVSWGGREKWNISNYANASRKRYRRSTLPVKRESSRLSGAKRKLLSKGETSPRFFLFIANDCDVPLRCY